jgi:hypothetical protein
MERRTLLLGALAGLALAAFGMNAPPAAQRPPGAHFVGRVAGSEAFIAVVVEGRQVLAYVCDGTPDTSAMLWGWFDGELAEGRAELVSTNGHALGLELGAGAPQGELLTRAGERLAFTTEAAVGAAGLVRQQGLEEGEPVLAGWVVLTDGQQRGAKVIRGTTAPPGYIDPISNL